MGKIILYDERHVANMQRKIDRLQNELFDERHKVTALERRRPHWDQGYSKDSIAAQSSTTALSQIWEMLGVNNQTSAVQKLREIITYVRCYS